MEPLTAFLIFLAVVVTAVALLRLRPRQNKADADITREVVRRMTGEFLLTSVQVDVKTFDGVVILGGFVRQMEQQERAIAIARAVPGVKTVDCRLGIRSGG